MVNPNSGRVSPTPRDGTPKSGTEIRRHVANDNKAEKRFSQVVINHRGEERAPNQNISSTMQYRELTQQNMKGKDIKAVFESSKKQGKPWIRNDRDAAKKM